MNLKRHIAFILLILNATIPMAAHHSFAAMYDGNKAIRLKGRLTKVEWTNPHSYFYVDVKTEDGKTVNWGAEGANPSALSRRGFGKGDIKIGDLIIIDGYAAKDGSHFIDARRITLPGGKTIFGGTPGDGGPGSSPATPSSSLPSPGANPNGAAR